MPYTEKEYKVDANGRAILLGPPKSGKTVAAVLTSPPPVFVVNGDRGGLRAAVRMGGVFEGEDCFSLRVLKETISYLKEETAAKKNPIKTVVVDSITGLGKMLESEIKRHFTGKDPRQMWGQYLDAMMGMMGEITSLPCHVIVTGHAIDMGDGPGSMGIVPLIPGKASVLIPALLIDDWLWLDVTPGDGKEKTKREFLLGAQGNWKHGMRSLQVEGRMEANFTKLFEKIKKAK